MRRLTIKYKFKFLYSKRQIFSNKFNFFQFERSKPTFYKAQVLFTSRSGYNETQHVFVDKLDALLGNILKIFLTFPFSQSYWIFFFLLVLVSPRIGLNFFFFFLVQNAREIFFQFYYILFLLIKILTNR